MAFGSNQIQASTCLKPSTVVSLGRMPFIHMAIGTQFKLKQGTSPRINGFICYASGNADDISEDGTVIVSNCAGSPLDLMIEVSWLHLDPIRDHGCVANSGPSLPDTECAFAGIDAQAHRLHMRHSSYRSPNWCWRGIGNTGPCWHHRDNPSWQNSCESFAKLFVRRQACPSNKVIHW